MLCVGRPNIDLGLERVRRLLCAVQHPERAVSVVHVAGTNGKGSTSMYVANGLTTVYGAVGLFLSPYLLCPWDAWQIRRGRDSVEIATEAEFHAIRASLTAHVPDATVFELDFAGFLLWLRGLSIAVVEVGLGGRDDATNVFGPYPCACGVPPISRTLLSVITPIGLDHERFLGSTVCEIAEAKAGIIASRALFAQQCDEVREVLMAAAEKRGVPATIMQSTESADDALLLSCAGRDGFIDKIPLALHRHTKELSTNSALAWAALRILIPEGRFDRARVLDALFGSLPSPIPALPGRRDRVMVAVSPYDTVPLIVDGAHNPLGADMLCAWIASQFTAPITYIVGMSGGRDPKAFLRHLIPSPRLSDTLIAVGFTPPYHMPWVKSLDPSEIAQAAQELGIKVLGEAPRIFEMPSSTLIRRHRHTKIVVGSLYLAADTYRWRMQNTGPAFSLERLFASCLSRN